MYLFIRNCFLALIGGFYALSGKFVIDLYMGVGVWPAALIMLYVFGFFSISGLVLVLTMIDQEIITVDGDETNEH